MKPGEEIYVTIEPGKMLLIHLDSITEPDEQGKRTIQFELNGMPREIIIADKHITNKIDTVKKADPGKIGEVGATLSGSVVKILVAKGQQIKKGEPILVTEAMKMETTMTSPIDGTVTSIETKAGKRIESGDLLLVIE